MPNRLGLAVGRPPPEPWVKAEKEVAFWFLILQVLALRLDEALPAILLSKSRHRKSVCRHRIMFALRSMTRYRGFIEFDHERITAQWKACRANGGLFLWKLFGHRPPWFDG